MFDFFKKKKAADIPAAPNPGSAQVDEARRSAFKTAINEKKVSDPLIGAKMGAKEVNQRLINGLKNQKGVHIESFLTALGALAGFSCQMSVREALGKKPEGAQTKVLWTKGGSGDFEKLDSTERTNAIRDEIMDKQGGDPTKPVLVTVKGADGKKYFFGDSLNKPLAENQYSVWSLAAGGAQKLGASVPDVAEIFTYVAGTIGTPSFGVPRIPADHRPGDAPLNYLKVIWPNIFPVVTQFCDDPAEWPVLFAVAVQEAIVMAKDVIDPRLAVVIVMECAIPMSKVELPEFYRFSDPQ